MLITATLWMVDEKVPASGLLVFCDINTESFNCISLIYAKVKHNLIVLLQISFMIDLKIIFLGTPDFAVASLKALVEADMPVVAVVTAPDRKKGRGQTVVPSPVKEFATKHELPVLQPTNLKDPAFIKELAGYEANLQIVVAFRMLPEVVWNMPALGTFNLHASLLPDYRGAAPINWAIINGESVTGVTTFFLKHEIDTGEIIFQEQEQITQEDTVASLYDRLMAKGAQLVLKTVEAIAEERVKTTPQVIKEDAKIAPKIFKETCEINWRNSFKDVFNFIRGLNPYPGAWTIIDGMQCKIYGITQSDLGKKAEPGAVVTDHKTKISVRAADKWVDIMEIQLPGKKKMKVDELLRGNSLANIDSI
jgi:methionyl-tRNA formyltransferase